MRKVLLSLIVVLLMLVAARTEAQVALTGYVGATTDHQPDIMVMGDIGTKIVLEPWVEGWNGAWSYGSELLLFPTTRLGGVVGIDNGVGAHVGVAYNLKALQVRAMIHTRGAWEGVILYNFYLGSGKRLYIQPWIVPTSDHTSRALVGLGYTFKQ